ncbi:TPA: phosphomethylpyrimidine synthase [bacterium]|nr:phosphomethylpyrimidine synthase [bacterium]
MNQMVEAKADRMTEAMKTIAQLENQDPDKIKALVASGRVVIPKNKKRKTEKICGIGEGLRVKVNANIGTSPKSLDLKREISKAKVAAAAGADTLMDLSTGGDLTSIRRAILQETDLPLGTVPVYQAAIEAIRQRGSLVDMTKEEILNAIRLHAEDGVDFVTLHCGITQETITRLKRQGRLMDLVSRGGTFLVEWMVYHRRENPLYEAFDEILKIAKEYDLTLSLGDGLRPGALVDATDRPQVQELILLGELTKLAHKEGVQVIIEGPGHMPLDQIELNVLLEKRLCDGAPFYVLGPLVTDIAPGYDHITSAIGGALACWKGADFLCYVTPGEHLRLPTEEDIREGVISARIAAHAADIAKGIEGAKELDKVMARCRKNLDWEGMIEHSLDPIRVKTYRERGEEDVCSMCGEYCVIKMVNEYLKDAL